MSASPRPHTDESPGGDAEGWALLEGLRRRLDEQANQHRKTQTQVTQLAESIAALVTAQRKRARWLDINSFVAYLIFTMLCGGAFYLLYESRASDLVSDRDRVASERDAAVTHSKEVSEQLAAREAADVEAWDAFQLLETGKREEATKKLHELGGAPLSKLERHVLEARTKQAEIMEVEAALKAAAASFKAGRHAEVVEPLEAALELESVGPRAALMHYYVGVAYSKAGALDKAVDHLQHAVEGDVPMEDARYHYASALDRAGQWGRARVEYERFATKYPQSRYTTFATRRSWTLARKPAVAPAKAEDPEGGTAADTPATNTNGAPNHAAPKPATAPKPAAPKPAAPKPAPAPQPAPQPAAPAQPSADKPAPKTLDFSESE